LRTLWWGDFVMTGDDTDAIDPAVESIIGAMEFHKKKSILGITRLKKKCQHFFSPGFVNPILYCPLISISHIESPFLIFFKSIN
jgi:hypothetical protein